MIALGTLIATSVVAMATRKRDITMKDNDINIANIKIDNEVNIILWIVMISY